MAGMIGGGVAILLALCAWAAVAQIRADRVAFVKTCASVRINNPAGYLADDVIAYCNRIYQRRLELDHNGWRPTNPAS